jgi:hypothetical protein
MHHFSRPFQQQCWVPRSTSWVPVARGLISYGPNFIDQYRFAASYVDRILKCEKRPILQYRRRPNTSGRQSQNRQGDRRDNPTVIACERRRGDRIGRAIAAMHESGIVQVFGHRAMSELSPLCDRSEADMAPVAADPVQIGACKVGHFASSALSTQRRASRLYQRQQQRCTRKNQ